MKANVDSRKPLSEKELVRNLTILLAKCRNDVETQHTLDSQDILKRVEALFNHMIEVTVEGEGGVIATLEYKPLKPREGLR